MSNSMLIVGVKPDGSTVRRTLRGIGYNFQSRVDSWVMRGYSQATGYPSNESTGKAFETVRAYADGKRL